MKMVNEHWPFWGTQNGVDLLDSEELLDNTKEFFPITDLNRFGDTIGIKYVNPSWYHVGGLE